MKNVQNVFLSRDLKIKTFLKLFGQVVEGQRGQQPKIVLFVDNILVTNFIDGLL